MHCAESVCSSGNPEKEYPSVRLYRVYGPVLLVPGDVDIILDVAEFVPTIMRLAKGGRQKGSGADGGKGRMEEMGKMGADGGNSRSAFPCLDDPS